MSDESAAPVNHISADDARRAARNVGALVLASVLSKGVLFVWQIVLAPLLGPAEFGIYNTVIALMAVGTAIANFGIGPIAIREVASHPKKIDQYAASMLVSQTVLSLVSYVGVLALALAFDYSPTILAFTAIAAISLIIDIFGSIANDLLLARERMVVTSIVEIAHIVLRVALAGLALWWGWGLLGVYLATLLTGVLRSAVLWGIQWREGLRPQFPILRDLTWRMLVNSAPLAANALLFQFYQNLDKLMTTSIIGVESTGYIGIAFMIHFGIMELLSSQILNATYPLLSRYHASDTPETFGFLAEKLVRFMLIAGLPAALLLSIFSQEIIVFIFSTEYAPTAGILQIFIWYTLLSMMGNVFARALLIQNRQRQTLIIRVLSLALNAALNVALLVRLQDPRGAAIASVAAEMLALGLLAWVFSAAGFDWSQLFRSAGRVLLLGIVTAAVMISIGGMQPLAGMLAGAVVYLLGILRGGVLLPTDWDLLYRLVAALPGGDFIRRYWQRETTVNW